AAGDADARFRRPSLPLKTPGPHHHELADLPAQREAERDEPRRRDQFLARPGQAPASGAAPRRAGAGGRSAGAVQWLPPGGACRTTGRGANIPAARPTADRRGEVPEAIW